ncbi:hypothetical protein F4809DRAFT_611339 [Biscogniauxia mediterranea]|nr:hypothetical protein F4809DRAFT_611339 [Biscogniauxia mediterranea]
MDPLAALPAEVVLRVLNFASLGSIASLTLVSRAWHKFIDSAHQDVIYAAKAPGVARLREPEQYFRGWKSFTRYVEGESDGNVGSWKEICRRRLLLERSWRSAAPRPTETVIQVGRHPVWRFRPDFARRFIVSTSHAGGLYVTDMDSGALLWSLSTDEVRRFAHLEYQDGTAVWDRFRNSLEVWRTDLPGLARGQFRRVALLPHDVTTRGFQLSYHTLCVVSSEGQGFVYDFPDPQRPEDEPVLRTHVEIEEGAVGHLDQCEDAVMYSIGTHGYHLHDKSSGELLGHIHPHMTDAIYHIKHPMVPELDDNVLDWLPGSFRYVLPRVGRNAGLMQLQIEEGVHPIARRPLSYQDEWGAGMLSGKTMVGVSRGGRLVICADWRHALRGPDEFAAVTSVIECEPISDSFDLGGWLHMHETVGGKKIVFEIKDSIYVISLDDAGRFDPKTPAFAAHTCTAPELAVPVSFMGIYDDCIMSTFTTLGTDVPADGNGNGNGNDGSEHDRRPVHFPTKAIRVLSFAPSG